MHGVHPHTQPPSLGLSGRSDGLASRGDSSELVDVLDDKHEVAVSELSSSGSV